MKDKLFTKNYSLVVIGQIVSVLGSAVLRFALDLYVLDITGRADVFALVVALSAIPGILFTPIGGAIADRFNRRNLMVIFDFCSSGIVLVLLLLLGAGQATVPVIGVILAVLSIISAMYQPAVQSSVPLLVEKENLASANGIVSGVGALSGLLGPVLGGVLYGFVGLEILITASCIAFFLSAVMEIFINMPFTKQKSDRHIIPTIAGDMKVGLNYVTNKKPQIFKVIVLAAALNLFMTPFFIIGMPYILRITMHSSETMYGIGMGIGQLSTILGAILIGLVSKKLRLSVLHKVLFLTAALLLPIAFALTPTMLSKGYWPSFILFFLFGAVILFLMTTISVYFITLVQMETPNEMLGKVMAIIFAVAQCATPLGQSMYGVIFEQFSGTVYIPVLIAFVFTVAISFISKITFQNLSFESEKKASIN